MFTTFLALNTPYLPDTMSQEAEPKRPLIPLTSKPPTTTMARAQNKTPSSSSSKKDDPHNPMNWYQARKWSITAVVTMSVFAVTFTSSAYSVFQTEITQDFDISPDVFTLGLSIFVIGFAVGPPIWGPL